MSASDSGSGVAQMSFSNDESTWSGWRAYATSASWTLTTGDGSKTVYARFRDGVGNVSTNVTDTITLDTVAPTGSVEAIARAANLQTTGMKTIPVKAIEAQSAPTVRVTDT